MARKKQHGFSLIELQIVIAILVLLWVVGAVSVFTRFGVQLKTIAIVASPVALLAAGILATTVGIGVRKRRAAMSVERVLRSLEQGDPENARQGFLALPDMVEIRWALQDRRPRIIAAIAGPWPGREIAYRLHLRLLDRFLDDLAGPLRSSLGDWPENLFAPVLADIARRGDAGEATRALLDRASQEGRRALLGNLFGVIDPVAPQEPTPDWLSLLRPFREDLEQIIRQVGYPGGREAHLRRYLNEMAR